jgi:hypothetical protein
MLLKSLMERIDPQEDHEKLKRFKPGEQVTFKGNSYLIQQRTTLASGEAAVVLQGQKEQFVIGAAEFLSGIGS